MCKRMSGVTMLELMTALAVLAVLMGVGVPAFTSMMRNNQIAAESSSLVQALQLARSEALKRGERVSVCAAADAVTCAEEADWSNGWLLFADDFGDAGFIDPSDEVLQTWPGPVGGVAVNADSPAVTFTRTARAESEVTFNLHKSGCGRDQQRDIEVGLSGRVALSHSDCPEE